MPAISPDGARIAFERCSEGNFFLTRCATRQQQVGNIDAADQQQKSDSAKQQPKIAARGWRNKIEMQRLDGHFASRALRKLVVELSSNSTHLRLRLIDGDVVFQTRHYAYKHRLASDLFEGKRERHPHLRVESIVHAGWKNADNCVRLTVHADGFADEIAVRVKVCAPDSVTEDHDVIARLEDLHVVVVAARDDRRAIRGRDHRRRTRW